MVLSGLWAGSTTRANRSGGSQKKSCGLGSAHRPVKPIPQPHRFRLDNAGSDLPDTLPKARIGASVLSGFIVAMCIVDSMSIAAAFGFTGFSSGRSPVVILVMIRSSVQVKRRVWAMLFPHLPNLDHCRGGVTTLNDASAHEPCILTGSKPPISDKQLPSCRRT